MPVATHKTDSLMQRHQAFLTQLYNQGDITYLPGGTTGEETLEVSHVD